MAAGGGASCSRLVLIYELDVLFVYFLRSSRGLNRNGFAHRRVDDDRTSFQVGGSVAVGHYIRLVGFGLFLWLVGFVGFGVVGFGFVWLVRLLFLGFVVGIVGLGFFVLGLGFGFGLGFVGLGFGFGLLGF